jgi:hypothetical protein
MLSWHPSRNRLAPALRGIIHKNGIYVNLFLTLTIVYFLNGGSGTIQLAPGAYDATRLNPRDGTTENLGRVSGGTVEFRLPQQLPADHNIADDSDWVLIYRKGE